MDDDSFGCLLPAMIVLFMVLFFVATGGYQPPTPGAWGRYKVALLAATIVVTYLAYRERLWKTAAGGTLVLVAAYKLHQ